MTQACPLLSSTPPAFSLVRQKSHHSFNAFKMNAPSPAPCEVLEWVLREPGTQGRVLSESLWGATATS